MVSRVSVSVPIWFSLIRMLLAQPSAMPRRRRSGLVTKQVVAHDLDPVAQRLVQLAPALPVVLVQAVLDGDDGVVLAPARCSSSTSRSASQGSPPSASRWYLPSLDRTRWRPRPGPGRCPRPACSRPSRWPPAAPPAPRRCCRGWGRSRPRRRRAVARPFSSSTFLRAWKVSAPKRSASREGRGAHRHDHEFLDVDVVVGVGAAVEHVHHGHRQGAGADAAEVLVERQAHRLGGGLGHGQRDAQDGVGAQLALVGRCRPARCMIRSMRTWSVASMPTSSSSRSLHVVDGLEHALAAVAVLVAVAQFDRLVLAGRGAAGHGGPADAAVLQEDIDLDGGVAAGVEDLAGLDHLDETHVQSLSGGPRWIRGRAMVSTPRERVNRCRAAV